MDEIDARDCPHFLILFRDSKCQFRGLYAYYPDTEEVFKIYGTGPKQVTDNMFDKYFKYNSGGKSSRKSTQKVCQLLSMHSQSRTACGWARRQSSLTEEECLWLCKNNDSWDRKLQIYSKIE